MPFVIDASVVLAWAFDEPNTAADIAYNRLQRETGVAPGLWWYELRNVLVIGERRRRVTAQENDQFLRDLSRAVIVIDHAPDEAKVLALARRHGLTVYDAAYLELALREGLDLATLDTELAEAARAEGVPLVS